VLGQAQTGTGKTCAFGIPAIEKIDDESQDIQVLVLCPTRELAIQSAEELKNVAKYKKNVKIQSVYGGQPIDRQIMGLKKHPQIIIGTPGRVMDHMRRHTLKLSNLKMIILDEADEMLNMGFREDIDTVLKKVPEEIQTILFSATMSKGILDITSKYLKNPVNIKITHKQLTVPSIEQYYLEVADTSKLEVLSRLIDSNNIKLGLVFCNTKRMVDELASSLQARGYLAEALHGDMRQNERDKVMAQFRKGSIEILIATDVAARGIDVDNVEAVFNYDLPNDEEYYVHRIGRTGRAGKTGKSFTFVKGREIIKLKEIQQYTKSYITPIKSPTLLDVEETRMGALLETVKHTLVSGQHLAYTRFVEKIMEELNAETEDNNITSIDIAAALLKQYSNQYASVETPKNETIERPRIKKGSFKSDYKGKSNPYNKPRREKGRY
jgi:ATP-dependent RNA helicase DeaD